MSTEKPHPNSALYWFPPLEKSGLPVPETVFVEADFRLLVEALEPKEASAEAINARLRVHSQIEDTLTSKGPFAFLRSDLSSAKHNGPRAYRIGTRPGTADDNDIFESIAETVEDNEMKFWLAEAYPKAFMVRQWLSLKHSFTAFGMGRAGHPIAREFRVFMNSRMGERKIYFYWPHNAIEGHHPSDKRWKELLAEMGPLTNAEYHYLFGMATAAVAALQESEHKDVNDWSVDFAQDIRGQWWLIDMALARDSWRPE
jgi:hypothetical protein